MRCSYNFTKWIITAIIIPFALCQSPAYAQSSEEIFNWVKSELQVQLDSPVPVISFVTKEELQKVYRKHTAKAFKSWTGQYGEKKAGEMMDYYLKGTIGLYIPDIQKVYVGSFLEPCKRESIVAHELAHFVQVKAESSTDSDSMGTADKYLYNEMQSGQIESEFMERFCGAQ